jgi:tetratricopeptide (TPR) repeat protein
MNHDVHEPSMNHDRALLLLLLAVAPRIGSGGGDGGARPSADLQTARAFYEDRVSKDALDADSWHGLAVVLRRSEMHAEAAMAMSRAVKIAPTPVRHRELGLILRLAGYEKEGVSHLVESVRGGALSPTALLMIGSFQHEQGQYDLAVRTLELALRLTDPALRGGHAVALTMCLLDAGQYREARSAFLAAARDQEDFFTLASEFIIWLVSFIQ